MDAKERIARLDAEGLDGAFIHPSLSIMYESELGDAEMAQAYTRAYHRWLVDWCADSGGRLTPMAHLSLGDPEAAARELERAVKDGCKGGWVVQFTMTRKPHAHPDHDIVFCQSSETWRATGLASVARAALGIARALRFPAYPQSVVFLNVTASEALRQAFTSFFQYGTFDKFPGLKLVLLEVGAGWISYWLDRLDAVYNSAAARTVPLKERPSFYFKRQCWISADPDEHALPAMVDLIGADRFFWASDFPHYDHTGNYIHELEELEELADKLAPDARTKVLGENAKRVYGC